jgi:hypothetical protein
MSLFLETSGFGAGVYRYLQRDWSIARPSCVSSKRGSLPRSLAPPPLGGSPLTA